MEFFIVLFLAYLVLSTANSLLTVTFRVIKSNPKFSIKAFLSSLLMTVIGYFIKGHISIEIVLFGLSGFFLYILYLLLIEN